MADDEKKIKLGVEFDPASQQRAEKAADSLSKSVEKIEKSTEKAGKAAQTAGTRFEQALKGSDKNADKAAKSLDNLRQKYIKAADAADALEKKSAKAAGGGGSGLSLDKAEGLLGRAGASLSGIGLGGVGGAVSGGADTLQLILSAKEGLAGLGAAAGLTAGAAVAAAPAIIAMTKAVEAFDKQTELLTGELGARVRTIDTFLKATTGTGAERRSTITQNQQDITALNAKRDALQKIVDETFNDLQKKEGDFAARIRLSRDKSYNDAIAQVEALNKEITDLQRTSNAAFKELQSGKSAFLDIGEAAKTAREALTKDTLARAENTRQTALEQAQLKALSLDAAKQRIDSLKDEQTSLQSAIKVLKDSGDTSQEVTDKLKEYEAALKKNTDAQKYLNDVVIPAAENTKKLADAMKGIADLGGSFDQIGKSAQASAQELIDRDKRVADVQQRYNDDVEKINEQSLQRRTEVQKNYNDKLVDIAKSAADEAKAALHQLEQQQQDLRTDFARTEATEQRKQQYDDLTRRVKVQREEAKAAEDHARKLLQIQKDSQLEEQDLLLNRNFLGLFQLQQRRTAETEQANTEFVQQQQDRRQALQQETQDLAAQRDFERNERMIAFQQRNADAQLQYQRELVQVQQKQQAELLIARQSYNAELSELQRKTANDLRIRQSAYDRELQMAALYGQRRVQVEAQTQSALLAQANARLGALGAPTNMNIGRNVEVSNRRPFGGPVRAGEPTLVNDAYPGQRESVGGTRFPAGLGVFIPARGGNVQSNGGGVNITNQISGVTDPELVGRIAAQKTADAIKGIFG